MIPKAFIRDWRAKAPWAEDSMVEQDLVLSRCLVELYECPSVRRSIAFRGGTALQKLFLKTPSRYSDDIDLVQIKKEPIGQVLDEIRAKIDPILGKAQYKQTQGRVTLVYKFSSEDALPVPLKVKIEINNAEHFNVFPLKEIPFSVDSKWFSGKTECLTYSLDELMGTKLRAFYQRKKGRDLFDLYWVFESCAELSVENLIKAFNKYIEHEGLKISRAEFEKNIHEKKISPEFGKDIARLLNSENRDSFELGKAFELVESKIISKLAGNSWVGSKK